jgi:Icc-related predicted phosphoesterase
MRFIATSDVHGCWDELVSSLEPADVFIAAGDLTEGTASEFRVLLRYMEFMKYRHKIVIGGNHDEHFESGSSLATIKEQFKNAGVTYLCHEPHTITINNHSVKVFGSPYTLSFSKMAFEKNESELGLLYQDIPHNLDILISHGPANGILDKNRNGWECGSVALKDALKEKQPKVHVFGHIHDSYGAIFHPKGLLSINVSALGFTKFYEPLLNKPIVFDLYPDGTVELVKYDNL